MVQENFHAGFSGTTNLVEDARERACIAPAYKGNREGRQRCLMF